MKKRWIGGAVVAAVLAGAYVAADAYYANKVETEVRAYFERNHQVAQWEQLSTRLWDQRIVLKHLQLSGVNQPSVSIDKLEVLQFKEDAEVSQMHVRFEGVFEESGAERVSPIVRGLDEEEVLTPWMRSQLPLSAGMDGELKGLYQQGRVDMHILFKQAGMFDFSIDLQGSGFQNLKSMVEKNEEINDRNMNEWFAPVRLQSLALRTQDMGLLSVLKNDPSYQPDNLDMLLNACPQWMSHSVVNKVFNRDACDAISAFFEGRNQVLRMQVKAKNPLPLLQSMMQVGFGMVDNLLEEITVQIDNQ